MATPNRRPDPPLVRRLFDDPTRFRFFQAVRLLERVAPDRAPVGREGPPDREVARFGAALGLSFPASELTHLAESDSPAAPPRLTVAFLGLTGPLGVLPHPYSELIADRARAGDRTPAAFLDLFNHRFTSLFYRAWRKHRATPSLVPEPDDPLAQIVLALVGLGLPSLRNRHAFPDAAAQYYSGLFAPRHRTLVGLRALLSDFFELPIDVEPFEPRWLRLEPQDRSALGRTGRHAQLGVDLIAGARVRDVQGTFRLRIGSIGLDRFLALQPDGPDFAVFCQMVRLYVDGEFSFRVQLVLRASEVPPCRLGGGGQGVGARLGRHAWLASRPFEHDAEDAVFPARECST